jgi:hypothetical protein
MSPSRWQQEMPAACKNAGRPISAAASASQVARSRVVSSRGSPAPPASDRASGLLMLCRAGSLPPVSSPPPANAADASSGWW